MAEPKKFIMWPGDNFPIGILATCPFEVELGNEYILLEDIEKFVEGKWSAFLLNYDTEYCRKKYFFELESDAMAFKLKWV